MRYSRKLLITIVLGGTVAARVLDAQETFTPYQRLAAAFALESAGHPAEAIAAAESLVDARVLTPVDQARALDLEGISYLEIGETEKAIRALEAAEPLLGPADGHEMAAVLDNLGRVYVNAGEYAGAERLYDRAFRLDEAAGDHGGMMRVANNQAGLALIEGKSAKARRSLERSQREARIAKDVDNEDRAAMASMAGLLAEQEGDAGAALREYQRAFALWKTMHGEQHPETAWGMMLVGHAQAATGDLEGGEREMRAGLGLMAATVGTGGERYPTAEMAYAGVLTAMGRTAQAAALRQDAATKLQHDHKQCSGCTISVMALR